MRIGLDTSVVLRLLTGEPEPLALVATRRVEAILAAGHCVIVSDLVASETYFALQHHYGATKQDAIAALTELARFPGIDLSDAAVSILALPKLFSARPGFVDRLIHAEYLRTADEMLTFEKAASRLARVAPLPVDDGAAV